jgi:hypothetical protein
MSTIDALDRRTSGPAVRHALPDPGESVPGLALPTLGIFLVDYDAWGTAGLSRRTWAGP